MWGVGLRDVGLWGAGTSRLSGIGYGAYGCGLWDVGLRGVGLWGLGVWGVGSRLWNVGA